MNFNGETRNATPRSEPDERGPIVAVSAFIVLLIAAGAGVVVHLRSSDTPAPQVYEESTYDPEMTAAASPTPPVFVTPSIAAPVANAVSASPDATAFDRARALALDGRDADARRLIERRVRRGKGTPDEARFLKQLCKKMHDTACVEDIKDHYASR